MKYIFKYILVLFHAWKKKSPTGDGAVVVYFLVTISWLDLKSLIGKKLRKFSNNEAVMTYVIRIQFFC